MRSALHSCRMATVPNFADVNAGFPPNLADPRPSREKASRGMSATSARHRGERLPLRRFLPFA